MDSVTLETLGLTKNEAKIYLALLKLGSASVSQIAKIAQIQRVNIYDTLERLKDKGLISSVLKSNKKYFEASSPENIKQLLEEKEKQIKQVRESFPQLIQIYNESNKQEVHSFKGIPGVKTVLKDILDTKPKEILNFGSTSGLAAKSPINFDIWESQREKLRMPMKIITSSSIKKTIQKKKYQEIKLLGNQFNSFSSTVVYENKVVILIWAEEPLAILIESKETADSYRNYFYSLWKQTKPQQSLKHPSHF